MVTTKKRGRKRGTKGHIMELAEKLKSGESFYIEAEPKEITSYATIYGYKVTTKQVLVVEDVIRDQPITKKITKVTVV